MRRCRNGDNNHCRHHETRKFSSSTRAHTRTDRTENYHEDAISKMSKNKNNNTLLAYFTKSPKIIASPVTAQTPGKENVSASPAESAGRKSNAHGQTPESASQSTGKQLTSKEGSSVKRKRKTSSAVRKCLAREVATSCPFSEGDLVWAKLEGHPWWPSLVGKAPSSSTHHRLDKDKKSSEIHVHFFGHPPSRAWIKEKYVKEFDKNKDTVAKSSDAKWQLALKAAVESDKLPANDRLSLILCSATSEDEADDLDCQLLDASDDDGGEQLVTPQKRKVAEGKQEKSQKRRRIIVVSESEGSEDEFKPVSQEDSDSDSINTPSDASVDDIVSEEESPKRKAGGKKRDPKATAKSISRPNSKVVTTTKPSVTSSLSPPQVESFTSPSVSEKTKARLSMFTSSDSAVSAEVSSESSNGKIFTHLTLDFLKRGQIRDSKRRLETDPEYDPKTLYVPEKFINSVTPAMRQWWEMKSRHFNVILFFKVGKFYEFYHMDAVIGVTELNLVFMKGDHAHAGFPEIAYGRYSAALIEKGYRVARVEQTENPSMMEERCKNMSKPTRYDKVVKREICQISTKGTRRYGFLDAQSNESNPAYLLAVTEKSCDSNVGDECDFGVCFVDTSIGKFRLGQFRDDRHGSRFRTLIAHISPVQVLYEKGALSTRTLQIIKNCVCDAIVDALSPKKEFWEADKTLQFLFENRYFNSGDDAKGEVFWPEVLKMMQDEGDCRGLTAKRDYAMAVKALGACTWYLCDSFLDQELLSMKSFEWYTPVDAVADAAVASVDSVAVFFRGKRNLVLDGICLKNLDILQNNATGLSEGTLLAKLDHCSTMAGKRLLRQWICTPLCDANAIDERLDAIKDLIKYSEFVPQAVVLLKKLPDLERLLSKIHTQGSALRSQSHPDSRAMFFDDNIYSKRKILDFLSALRGFRVATEIVGLISTRSEELESKLLRRCVIVGGDGMFPDLEDLLAFFDNAFDHEKAQKEGKIIPSKGVDSDYDTAAAEIKELGRKLDSYLEKQCRFFQCKVTYVGTGRNRFQLEVRDSAVKRADNEYELQGQRKGFKRYWTAETKDLLSRMMNAEEVRDSALRDIMRRIFATFSKDFIKWDQAVQCLAILDVLISLAHYSQCGGGTMCRPSVLAPTDKSKPFIEIRDGYHPFISTVFSGGDFIPNDTAVGTTEYDTEQSNSANLVLVTGPNMGGKSTLMRQVGLIVIMAQLGCYVPASMCRLTLVDRVFTRLGASDRIMHGESTFFVELSETACILKHATPHSLVLVDELGRGTSTYDGVAIAHAVVQELAQRIRCRTFFSTHYHSLVGQFSHDVTCQLGHMACLVENENEDDPTEETITFLYKFVHGGCPKSYGFNAAKLAGIPNDVVKVAHHKAKEMEDITEAITLFRKLNQMNHSSVNGTLVELISAIKLN